MANHADLGKKQLDLRRSLETDDPSERIDSLWRQVMVYKAFTDSDLSEAKARRADAEKAREKAEGEAAEATRLLCEGLKHDAEQKLKEAETLRAEATAILQQAEAESARALSATKEIEEARERIVAEANQRAQEILDQARLAAQRECTELRHQALGEIKAVLGRVDSIRLATDEELETQRIFSNIARLRATPESVMAQTNHDGDGAAPVQEIQPQDGALSNGAETPSQTGPVPVAAAAPAESSGNSPEPPSEPAKVEASARKDNHAKGKQKKA